MPPGMAFQFLHVRRYDVDLVPSPDLMLEIGDRVGVLVPSSQIATARAHFGDTVKSAAEFSYISVGFGMVLGVLLGLVPIPVPGVGTVTLGIGGGPLHRGADCRTAAPDRADQLGHAAAGEHRAAEFRPHAVPRDRWHQLWPGLCHDRCEDRPLMLLIGAAVLLTTVAIVLLVGLLRCCGSRSMICSVLHRGDGQSRHSRLRTRMAPTERPDIGYAMIFPSATIVKVIAIQIVGLVALGP